jgi:hypothetical protein
MESCVSESLHPAAPHHLPSFITAPGETDVLMIVVGIILIGSILAMIDLPDFGTPLRSIAGSVEKIAGVPPGDEAAGMSGESAAHTVAAEVADTTKAGAARSEARGHA